MSGENVETMRAAIDAWNRGDADGWLAAAHPEAEWVSDVARRVEGTERVYRGREAMREFWDEWHTLWDMRIEVGQIQDHGQSVLALVHVRAQGRASGVELDEDIAYLARFDADGLIVHVRTYLDPGEAIAAAQARGAYS